MRRILIVSYFNVEDAKNAFNWLRELKFGEERVQAAYVYNESSHAQAQSQTQLTSIHESSDSGKSDSDSEKGKSAVSPAPESKKDEETKETTPGEKRSSYNPLFTPPRPPRPSVFNPLKKKDFNKTTYIDKMHDYSNCSFDGDMVNEGSANVPRNSVPKPFPASYYHTPTGSALHTESTTNIDSDEALSSSGYLDREASSSFYSPEHFPTHSRTGSNMSQSPFVQPDMYHSPNGTCTYSQNPQLLWTQPVRRLPPAVPGHMHTRSYDVAACIPSPPPMYPYACSSPYDSAGAAAPMPMNYYTQYVEPTGEYSWEDQMGYADPYYMSSTMPYPAEIGRLSLGKKSGRKKNPESAANRAMFAVSLEDILSRKDLRTTIMIKNIPNKYNQKMLLKKIDEISKRQYDFFYLPIDFKVSVNSSADRTSATWATPSSTLCLLCTS